MKFGTLAFAAMLGMTACVASVERPVIRPSEVSDFRVLYARNCSGCHGQDGRRGLSVALATPVYLAIADDLTIRRAIAQGVPRTTMPAFGQRAGGLLTEAQIDILVHGIRVAGAAASVKERPPAYASSQPGDVARGQNVFATFCSSCHGPGGKAGSVVDRSYLALVSDQFLRTVIITGVPDLGMPDWRGHGQPLSDADITDVVAWLVAQRTNHPGGSE